MISKRNNMHGSTLRALQKQKRIPSFVSCQQGLVRSKNWWHQNNMYVVLKYKVET
jgi:hypothetical protein